MFTNSAKDNRMIFYMRKLYPWYVCDIMVRLHIYSAVGDQSEWRGNTDEPVDVCHKGDGAVTCFQQDFCQRLTLKCLITVATLL